MNLPLEGIKVLDLTKLLPGPFCSMILADFGAEVVKIEQPGKGDYVRRYPPFNKGFGSIFLALNRNKKSLSINLKEPAAKEIFYRLVQNADVILEGFRPGVAKKMNIDYDTLKKINPRLIYCSISGYGQDGPYAHKPGHDVNYLGYAGVLGLTGHATVGPVLPGVQIADIGGGALMAIIGILLSIIARRYTGKGQYVDISMLDGLISWLVPVAGSYFIDGIAPGLGETRLTGKYACYGVYQTKDGGYITLGAFEEHFWKRLCRYFGKDEYIAYQYVDEKQNELFAFFREQFAVRDRDEWVVALEEQDICCGPVYNLAEVFNDPQVLHRMMISEIEHPCLGKIKQLGFPIKLSATPADLYLPPPSLGEHTEQILTELGYSRVQIGEYRKNGLIGG
ncbi:MAG: CoA transferase [Firmicutes bacterium]|nr:CoA transferase [Bacillota bacterium]